MSKEEQRISVRAESGVSTSVHFEKSDVVDYALSSVEARLEEALKETETLIGEFTRQLKEKTCDLRKSIEKAALERVKNDKDLIDSWVTYRTRSLALLDLEVLESDVEVNVTHTWGHDNLPWKGEDDPLLIQVQLAFEAKADSGDKQYRDRKIGDLSVAFFASDFYQEVESVRRLQEQLEKAQSELADLRYQLQPHQIERLRRRVSGGLAAKQLAKNPNASELHGELNQVISSILPKTLAIGSDETTTA